MRQHELCNLLSRCCQSRQPDYRLWLIVSQTTRHGLLSGMWLSASKLGSRVVVLCLRLAIASGCLLCADSFTNCSPMFCCIHAPVHSTSGGIVVGPISASTLNVPPGLSLEGKGSVLSVWLVCLTANHAFGDWSTVHTPLVSCVS